MLVKSLGHAGLEIDYGGARLQMDPWLTAEGAFQASWFQWPDNTHLASELKAPDAVMISHEHLDHVDTWWLGQLPRETRVYVPRYPLGILRRKLAASGLPVTEVDAWSEFEPIPGVKAFFVTERSPMNHDAGIVVSGGGRVVVNANDARLCPLQLREIRAKVGHIDLLAVQGAGASWYPMVYSYPEERQKKLAYKKRMSKFAYLAQAVAAAEPGMILPFAGPPAFLDAELFHLNDQMDEGIFPDHEQVALWLRSKGFDNVSFLYPGDRIDLATQEIARDARWDGFSYKDRSGYLQDYASRRQEQIARVKSRFPVPDRDLWPAFRAYFEDLLTYSPYFNRKIGMKVGFEITGPGGGEWAVDFREGSMGVYRGLGGIAYKYRFESRWLPPILEGLVPWEDFMLSCRLSAWRDPDVYNDHLLGLLKFADREALAAVEEWEQGMRSDEKIQVRSGANQYEVQRFCPHAGQDLLESGEILPGDIIRCNGHHYEFDLNTGQCLTGNSDPLTTRSISLTA